MWNCLLHISRDEAFVLLCTWPRDKWLKEGGSCSVELLICVEGNPYISFHVWFLHAVCYINSRVFESLKVMNYRSWDIIYTLYFSVCVSYTILIYLSYNFWSSKLMSQTTTDLVINWTRNCWILLNVLL